MVEHVLAKDETRVRFPLAAHEDEKTSSAGGFFAECEAEVYRTLQCAITSQGRENLFATANKLFLTQKNVTGTNKSCDRFLSPPSVSYVTSISDKNPYFKGYLGLPLLVS